MKKVCASILGQDNKISLVNNLIKKGIDWIHYDNMDGNFVPRQAMPIKQIKDIVANTDMHTVDIHLMSNYPERDIIEALAVADYVTFHFEAESYSNMKRIFKKYGYLNKIGIAISPKSKVSFIKEFLQDASHVLVMSVEPGRGGQTFQIEAIDKIKELRKEIDSKKLNTFIQVDGGIDDIVGPQCIAAGANALVSGMFVIKNISKDKNIIKKILGD